ncbi:MAG: ABC transporter ATP-binding protein [Candidatus Njordarchaeia archaeon]
MEAIKTENLIKYYGKVKALNGLNLTVQKGDCVGLLGPNGAGKTTTIKILTGLLKPTQGEAYIRGISVLDDPEEALKNVGAMIETPELYPELTPREMLTYLGKLRGLSDPYLSERIREVLETVKMIDWIDTPIGKFSRGMKQRIAIAQTILHDPEIIILDEPSLGLDPRGMAEVRGVIVDLNRQGKTILVASHLLYEVQQMCNKVALINKGNLLLYDDITALDSMLKSINVLVRLAGSINDGVLDKIKGINGVKSVGWGNNHTVSIVFTGGESKLPSLLRSLVSDLGLDVLEFRKSETTLEAIYLELIEEVS